MTYQPRLTVFEPRRPLTPEEDDRIRELHEAGLTPHQIGQEINRAHPIIYRRLRAMGFLPPVKKHKKPRPAAAAASPSASADSCKRCTITLAKTPRPSARGLCCYCLEEGH